MPPWCIMHLGLANGPDFKLYSRQTSATLTARDYVRGTGCNDLFGFVGGNVVTRRESREPFVFEDHPGQWLFIASEMGMDEAETMLCSGQIVSIADLVESEMKALTEYSDPTWRLAGLLNFGRKSAWENKFGEKVSVASGVSAMSKQPLREIEKKTCKGTHYFYTLAKYRALETSRTEAIDRLLGEAYSATLNTIEQMPKNKKHSPSDLHFLGHSLEWIVWSANAEELRGKSLTALAARVCDCVRESEFALSASVWDAESRKLLGDYCHCIHGLRLYKKRLQEASKEP